jgi:hypothetical protein
VKDYGELDMSNPTVLRDFIEFCQTQYPAKRTVLTLWDHGMGVYPKSLPKSKAGGGVLHPQGICWDDTTGSNGWDCLTTDEIAIALAQARSVTGQKMDIVNMDACLMQMIEIAYEWKNEVNYLVGSEEIVPGSGNDYGSVLADLVKNPTVQPEDLAVNLVETYYDYYVTEGEGLETYSLLSLGADFTVLMTAFSELADELSATNDMGGVYEAYQKTTQFDVLEFRDLHHFAQNLTTYSADPSVIAAANQLLDVFDIAVLNHRETWGYEGKAFGLAINLPTADEWDYYAGDDQYVTLQFAEDTQWDEFLLRFVAYTSNIL